MATTISHYGVTVTLAGTHTTGLFANGEPWIAGSSFSLTSISNPPYQSPSANARHGGAMLNPIPTGHQGYAQSLEGITPPHVHAYDSALDVSLSLPLAIVAGDYLAVAITRNDAAINGKNTIYVMVGFTFLATAPAAGSLRPGPFGSGGRTVTRNVSGFNWSVLKNLSTAAVPNLPTKSYMEDVGRNPALPWWEWGPGWEASTIRPWLNVGTMGDGNSGQYYSYEFSRKALWLNCNLTQSDKEKVLIQFVQQGIDIASYIANGGNFFAGGSHQLGAKVALAVAAAVLNDSAMIAMVKGTHFIEDITTFFVTETDVGRVVDNSAIGGSYISGDIGLAEWGILHDFSPQKDDRHLNAGYRGMWSGVVGGVLAMRFMGLESMGELSMFAYTERYITGIVGLAGFELEMYNAHYGNLGPLSPQATTFSPNSNTLESGSYLSLVAAAGLTIYYTTNGTTPTDSSTLYTAPLLQSASLTYKAIAYSAVSGQLPSPVATRSITVDTTGAPGPVSNFAAVQA